MNFEDYDLPDEVKAKLKADYDEDVKGLKSKNSDLISRLDKQKTDHEAAILEQIQAQEDAKVALAEKEGDIEKYKIALQERDDALSTVKREFQEKENLRLTEAALHEFSAKLTPDPAGRMYMQKQFSDQIEVRDGQVVPKDVTKTLDDLKSALVSDKANADYVLVDVGTGAGSVGSKADGSALSDPNKYKAGASEKDRIKYQEQRLRNAGLI